MGLPPTFRIAYPVLEVAPIHSMQPLSRLTEYFLILSATDGEDAIL